MFRDRTEAGQKLAGELAAVVRRPAVVAAIPRGGVSVALPVVERLRVPLTVVYARKLTSRVAPELAVGALDEDGEAILASRTVALLGLDADDVDRVKTRVAAEIRRRMAIYRVPPLSHYLPGATVVLVDDGLATGLTMRAAVAYARRHGAREIIVAVPCASEDAARRFRAEADRFLSLVVDPDFYAVGAYYMDFSPVSDEEVLAMLAEAQKLAERPVVGMRLLFHNSRGFELAGELLMPDTAGPHPIVVFAHGWGSSKASPPNRAIAEALVAKGISAFLFDFTGHGESQGTPEDSTEAQQVDDLRAAIAALGTLDDIDTERLGIAGASSGSEAVLRCAADLPAVRALVLRSANVAGAAGAAGVAAALDVAARVKAPTLLVVGERDAPVLDQNEALVRLLAGPRRLEIVPRGDHLFEDREALARAAELTTAWFSKHLG
ncbi:MAG: alpha/beta fold hydrolase [Candidatus Rokubacteria bacterium]|nr:alpha/beta fold hydrolase [Candidatus Rokubacteria bacterium]